MQESRQYTEYYSSYEEFCEVEWNYPQTTKTLFLTGHINYQEESFSYRYTTGIASFQKIPLCTSLAEFHF